MLIHIQIVHLGLLRTKLFFLQTAPSGTTMLDMGYSEMGEAPQRVMEPMLKPLVPKGKVRVRKLDDLSEEIESNQDVIKDSL